MAWYDHLRNIASKRHVELKPVTYLGNVSAYDIQIGWSSVSNWINDG